MYYTYRKCFPYISYKDDNCNIVSFQIVEKKLVEKPLPILY